jgi:hypothetical protein
MLLSIALINRKNQFVSIWKNRDLQSLMIWMLRHFQKIRLR